MISLDGLGRSEDEAVLLVGAGSVAGAWEPIFDALGNRIPRRSADIANVYFASLVHRLRWLAAMVSRETTAMAEYRRELEAAQREYRDVVDCISRELRTANLTLRPEATTVRKKFLAGLRYRVVSTNWDFSASSLIDDSEDACIDYIHGTFSVGLYLPGEVVDEPFRGRDNRQEFFTSMLSTVHALKDAWRLVVYGLSVSALDAELGFVLQWANKNRRCAFEEIVVVDPSPEPVIGNLTVHLGKQNYIAVRPEELDGFELH